MKKRSKTKSKSVRQKKTFLGQALLAAADDALAWHAGKKELRVSDVKIENPPEYSSAEIKHIRKELHMSQPVFAGIFGYSADAVKAWEQGSKAPNPAARRLLQLLVANKGLIDQFVMTDSL
jgi:putative transcriptional regulator